MGYLKDTIRGITWMGALRGFTRLIAFFKILILARILIPSEFGLFGIAILVLSLLEIVTETGVNVFLIQEKHEVEEYLDTAFVVSIIRGVLICLLLVLAAPLVAIFFKVPEAKNVILLMSVIPLIRGFINPSVVKFQKNLEFRREFFYRFFIYAIDGAVAIVLALKTHSAYSLVYGLGAGAIFEVVASYFVVKPIPQIRFEWEQLKLVISRGKWVTAAGFFNYAFENFDDAAVGRLLNTTSLGIYQVAYKITSLPMTEVSDIVQRVTFPVYAKISDDLARLKRAYLRSIGVTALLVIPLGLLLFIFPEFLVKTLLGEKWLAAVVVIRLMSFFGVARALIESTYPLFHALKKQQYVSLVTAFSLTTLLTTIVPLVKAYGIVGAGISGLAGSLVAIPITLFLLRRVFKA